jgi:choline-sulfatase
MNPNVILLGLDSLRQDVLRQRVDGGPVMPRVQALLESAISFEQCFVASPASIPSRVAFATGRYPMHGGHRVAANKLRGDEPELLSPFRAAGYDTALVGINHMADDEALGRIFARRITVPPSPLPLTTDSAAAQELYVGRAGPSEKDDQTQTTDAALDWISQDRGGAPFLLMLNWFLPHPPYRAPSPFYGTTSREALRLGPAHPAASRPRWAKAAVRGQQVAHRGEFWWREVAGSYLDSCRYIDHEVGRVLDHLDATGRRDDTVVLLWSDHGDFAGDCRLAEKWPTCFADVVTRVPAVLSAPWLPGGALTGLTETVDLLPTLLDVCGLDVPPGLNGRSLRPFFGRPDAAIRSVVTVHGGWEAELVDRLRAVAGDRTGWKYRALSAVPESLNRAAMVRDGTHKYIVRVDDEPELYDLRSDPWEHRNLVHNPALGWVREHLRDALIEALLRGGDHQPVPSLDGLVL